jgi:hypothetical protein
MNEMARQRRSRVDKYDIFYNARLGFRRLDSTKHHLVSSVRIPRPSACRLRRPVGSDGSPDRRTDPAGSCACPFGCAGKFSRTMSSVSPATGSRYSSILCLRTPLSPSVVVNLDESTVRRVASNLLNVYYFEVLNLVRSTTVYVYDSIR